MLRIWGDPGWQSQLQQNTLGRNVRKKVAGLPRGGTTGSASAFEPAGGEPVRKEVSKFRPNYRSSTRTAHVHQHHYYSPSSGPYKGKTQVITLFFCPASSDPPQDKNRRLSCVYKGLQPSTFRCLPEEFRNRPERGELFPGQSQKSLRCPGPTSPHAPIDALSVTATTADSHRRGLNKSMSEPLQLGPSVRIMPPAPRRERPSPVSPLELERTRQ